MNDFAWNKLSSEEASAHPRSQTRMKIASERVGDVSLALDEIQYAVRTRDTPDDAGILMALRLVEGACADLERWAITLGAQHVCDAWLDSCAKWASGIGETLVSAFSYDDGPERRIALALAAEESSMRLLMGVEREGKETTAMLKNLDRNAAESARELASRIELADRILQARL